jgi:hypothetical protein
MPRQSTHARAYFIERQRACSQAYCCRHDAQRADTRFAAHRSPVLYGHAGAEPRPCCCLQAVPFIPQGPPSPARPPSCLCNSVATKLFPFCHPGGKVLIRGRFRPSVVLAVPLRGHRPRSYVRLAPGTGVRFSRRSLLSLHEDAGLLALLVVSLVGQRETVEHYRQLAARKAQAQGWPLGFSRVRISAFTVTALCRQGRYRGAAPHH